MDLRTLKGEKTGCPIQTPEKALAVMAGKTRKETSGFQLARVEEHIADHIGMYKHPAAVTEMSVPASKT